MTDHFARVERKECKGYSLRECDMHSPTIQPSTASVEAIQDLMAFAMRSFIAIIASMTGPQRPIDPGVPSTIRIDPTPVQGIRPAPMVGNPPHLDLEETLRQMHETVQTLKIHLSPSQRAFLDSDSFESGSIEDDEFITTITKRVSRKQMAGKILMWIVGVVGAIFSAGMAWAVMVGENATDTEVRDAVQKAVVNHNGGKDPEALNGDGEKNGHHPDLRGAIEDNGETLTKVKTDVTDIKESQKKSDKRAEYQFEFSRWQAKVTECERTRRCRPPKKPKKLDDLESDLMLGKFD